jgi:hypothetical protein
MTRGSLVARSVHEASGGKGIWVWDRGADRNELMVPWLHQEVDFVIRQRGDRHVQLDDGSHVEMKELAEQLRPPRGRRWPRRGKTRDMQVRLPEAPEQSLLLVMHWPTKCGTISPLGQSESTSVTASSRMVLEGLSASLGSRGRDAWH